MLTAALMLISAALPSSEPQSPRTGEALIHQMYQRYAGTWYSTLTFVQSTKFPNGTSQIWYEAAKFPGMLRIDIAPLDSGRAILFRNDSIYQFNHGALTAGRPFVHPLMVLGFDVYFDQPEKTIGKLKGLSFDLSKVQAGTWQGKAVWIVGTATPGDTATSQFWVDQENLLFVRMFQRGPQGMTNEVQFNKYARFGGAWISPEVLQFSNGQPGIIEEYNDVKIGMTFGDDLFDPARFGKAAWIK
ncbi:MAG: hypothetical protein EXR93_02255 [Gemmatimonadetes bacterium]|nr:hypothetical protein [Gemmatimonadota bacterium]